MGGAVLVRAPHEQSSEVTVLGWIRGGGLGRGALRTRFRPGSGELRASPKHHIAIRFMKNLVAETRNSSHQQTRSVNVGCRAAEASRKNVSLLEQRNGYP